MRGKFCEIITDLIRKDKKIYLLTGDFTYGLFDDLKRENPSHYINTGVTEQASMGMAAGMALEGLKPYFFSILPFTLERPFEQIKLDVVQQKANVKIVAFWDYPTAGPTHLTKDPEALCKLLGLKFIKPRNREEAERVLIESSKNPEPMFIYLTKDLTYENDSS